MRGLLIKALCLASASSYTWSEMFTAVSYKQYCPSIEYCIVALDVVIILFFRPFPRVFRRCHNAFQFFMAKSSAREVLGDSNFTLPSSPALVANPPLLPDSFTIEPRTSQIVVAAAPLAVLKIRVLECTQVAIAALDVSSSSLSSLVFFSHECERVGVVGCPSAKLLTVVTLQASGANFPRMVDLLPNTETVTRSNTLDYRWRPKGMVRSCRHQI
jgi:hypothetical protein